MLPAAVEPDSSAYSCLAVNYQPWLEKHCSRLDSAVALAAAVAETEEGAAVAAEGASADAEAWVTSVADVSVLAFEAVAGLACLVKTSVQHSEVG